MGIFGSGRYSNPTDTSGRSYQQYASGSHPPQASHGTQFSTAAAPRVSKFQPAPYHASQFSSAHRDAISCSNIPLSQPSLWDRTIDYLTDNWVASIISTVCGTLLSTYRMASYYVCDSWRAPDLVIPQKNDSLFKSDRSLPMVTEVGPTLRWSTFKGDIEGGAAKELKKKQESGYSGDTLEDRARRQGISFNVLDPSSKGTSDPFEPRWAQKRVRLTPEFGVRGTGRTQAHSSIRGPLRGRAAFSPDSETGSSRYSATEPDRSRR